MKATVGTLMSTVVLFFLLSAKESEYIQVSKNMPLLTKESESIN